MYTESWEQRNSWEVQNKRKNEMFTELKVKVGVIFTGNAGNGFNCRASGSGAVAVGGRCTEIGLIVNFDDS